MVSRTYDLKSHRIAELSEEMVLPRGDPRSRALADMLATMSMVIAPIQYYTKRFSPNLTMIRMMLLQGESHDELLVSTQ
jgi:hypothetical protein